MIIRVQSESEKCKGCGSKIYGSTMKGIECIHCGRIKPQGKLKERIPQSIESVKGSDHIIRKVCANPHIAKLVCEACNYSTSVNTYLVKVDFSLLSCPKCGTILVRNYD